LDLRFPQLGLWVITPYISETAQRFGSQARNRQKQAATIANISVYFCRFLAWLTLSPENLGVAFFRNVDLPPNYIALQSRRPLFYNSHCQNCEDTDHLTLNVIHKSRQEKHIFIVTERRELVLQYGLSVRHRKEMH
jgi:hypothetical protein